MRDVDVCGVERECAGIVEPGRDVLDERGDGSVFARRLRRCLRSTTNHDQEPGGAHGAVVPEADSSLTKCYAAVSAGENRQATGRVARVAGWPNIAVGTMVRGRRLAHRRLMRRSLIGGSVAVLVALLLVWFF